MKIGLGETCHGFIRNSNNLVVSIFGVISAVFVFVAPRFSCKRCVGSDLIFSVVHLLRVSEITTERDET